jgi:hypothetical protein
MSALAALFALISFLALLVAPARSQPAGRDMRGLMSPAPMTGSSLEHRFVPNRKAGTPSSTPTLPQEIEQEATAPPHSSPGPLWARRKPAPAATDTSSQIARPTAPRTTPKQTARPAAPRTTPRQAARRLGTVQANPRRTAVKEGSVEKRQGTEPRRVNRPLGAKPTRGPQETKSRATWATRETRRIAPARTELAPRAAPALPHSLMPRHARW